MFELLYLVPKNHLSYIVGKLAYIKAPRFITTCLIRWFANRYGANLLEAEKAVAEYPSLGDFFVRDLKDGLRPIAEGVVSPVDAIIAEFGKIDGKRLLQVKGKYYNLEDLLRDRELAESFRDGFFITFYLAPGDYHHIHSPVDGEIVSSIHIEGKLWPVNHWSVKNIKGVFAVNERIISVIDSMDYGKVAVVKVGATNVGSIALSYDDVIANHQLGVFRRKAVYKRDYPLAHSVMRGERIGTFQMGSTVVLLFEAGNFSPGARCILDVIRLGEKLD